MEAKGEGLVLCDKRKKKSQVALEGEITKLRHSADTMPKPQCEPVVGLSLRRTTKD